MPPRKPPLWTCPECGNKFTGKNMAHSCGQWTLAHHFDGKPRHRKLFNALRDALKKIGRTRMVISKTRIVFMTRMRFASVSVRADHLHCHILLRDAIDDPFFIKSTQFTPRMWMHEFRVRDEADVEKVAPYLPAAYAVGNQE